MHSTFFSRLAGYGKQRIMHSLFRTGIGVFAFLCANSVLLGQANTLPLFSPGSVGIGGQALQVGPQRLLHLYAGPGVHGDNPVMRIGTGSAITGNNQPSNHLEIRAAHIGLVSETYAAINNNTLGAINYLQYSTIGQSGDFFISGGTIDNINAPLPEERIMLPVRNMIITNRSGQSGGGGNILFATTLGNIGDPDRERMRITSSGLVSIGNSDPKELFHVGDLMTFGVGVNEYHISYNEWSNGTTRHRLNTFGGGPPVPDLPTMSITFDRMRGGFMMLGNAGRGNQSTAISYDETLPGGNAYKGIVIGNEGDVAAGTDKGTIGLGNFPMPNTRVAIRGFRPFSEVHPLLPEAVSNALFVGRGDGISIPILVAKDNSRVGIGTSGPRDILQLGNRFVFHAGGSSAIAHNAYYNAVADKWQFVEEATETNHLRPARIGFWDGQISLQVGGTGAANAEAVFDNKGLFINNAGNVGIGELYPGVRMVVKGAAGLGATDNVFEVRKNDGTMLFAVNNSGTQAIGTTNNANTVLTLRGTTTNTNNTLVVEQHNGNSSLVVRNDGRVGIGVMGTFSDVASGSSSYGTDNTKLQVWGDVQIGNGWNSTVVSGMNNRLCVDGAVFAREVRVTANNWADFVFDDAYELPSLASVEQHIKEKGHLPGIPSEQEVKENGVSLNEMQVKLLQKVEELTLYVIELKKQNERLEQQLHTTK